MAARLAQYTILGALLAALAGCAHPAPYQRPATTLPDSYRGSPPGPEDPTAVALGDQKWPEVFKDEHLQELIRKALEGNYDVRIAATRILEAEQQVVIARADQFPTVTGSLGGTAVRSAQAGPFPAYSFAAGLLSFSASWNPDFWGRYKNATEAARANLLAVGWVLARKCCPRWWRAWPPVTSICGNWTWSGKSLWPRWRAAKNRWT